MTPITDGTCKFVVTKSGGVLPGTVTAFSGTFKDGYPVDKNTGLVDKEWHLCDGTNGTPDLRNRFIYGGDGTNNGTTGGKASVTLNVSNIPSHGHRIALSKRLSQNTEPQSIWYLDGGSESGVIGTFSDRRVSGTYPDGKHGYYIQSEFIEPTGGGQPHNNMPPYYTLAFIMKL